MADVKQSVSNSFLHTDLPSATDFANQFFETIDEVIDQSECEIYSYNPEADYDPFCESGFM